MESAKKGFFKKGKGNKSVLHFLPYLMIFKVECSKGVVEQKCGKKEEKLPIMGYTKPGII